MCTTSLRITGGGGGAGDGSCMVWVCAGMSNHEISEKLEVSSKTVDNHVSNLFKKLELPSRHKMIAKYAPWVNVMADRSA